VGGCAGSGGEAGAARFTASDVGVIDVAVSSGVRPIADPALVANRARVPATRSAATTYKVCSVRPRSAWLRISVSQHSPRIRDVRVLEMHLEEEPPALPEPRISDSLHQ